MQNDRFVAGRVHRGKCKVSTTPDNSRTVLRLRRSLLAGGASGGWGAGSGNTCSGESSSAWARDGPGMDVASGGLADAVIDDPAVGPDVSPSRSGAVTAGGAGGVVPGGGVAATPVP